MQRRLSRDSNRFTAHSGLASSLQLTAEQPADSSRRSINRREQIGVAFLHGDMAERKQLRFDPAPAARRAVRAHSYRHMADPPAEPAERKPQSPLDVQVNRPSKISIAGVYGNMHFVLHNSYVILPLSFGKLHKSYVSDKVLLTEDVPSGDCRIGG